METVAGRTVQTLFFLFELSLSQSVPVFSDLFHSFFVADHLWWISLARIRRIAYSPYPRVRTSRSDYGYIINSCSILGALLLPDAAATARIYCCYCYSHFYDMIIVSASDTDGRQAALFLPSPCVAWRCMWRDACCDDNA